MAIFNRQIERKLAAEAISNFMGGVGDECEGLVDVHDLLAALLVP